MFKKHRHRFIFVIGFAAVIIPWIHLGPAIAATIPVTNTNDSGAGSLRQAIASAGAGDTINFSVTGIITLTTGQLLISQDLTITGPGATSLVISGNNVSGVFNITAGVTVNISGLTIQDGTGVLIVGSFYGGGIFNAGTLTLNNVTVRNNHVSPSGYGGGGIWNQGTITITNSEISNNSGVTGGGGIANSTIGTAILTNVTLSGNSAFEGGGIFNFGTLTLTNGTISNNTVTGTSLHDASGIYNFSGTSTLRNTIVANSVNDNCHASGGTITSMGHNLDSANTCGFTAPGDLTNTDPLLGPLALNSPGTTKTHALLAGSPAIEMADPTTFPSTDQRDVTRPQGAGPDIGAYEFVFAQTQTTAVPMMTQWGIIILIVVLGTGSVYYLRKRRLAV